MPFTGSNASVSTTIDEVVAHWTQVDVVVGGLGMSIKGNMLRAGFEARVTKRPTACLLARKLWSPAKVAS